MDLQSLRSATALKRPARRWQNRDPVFWSYLRYSTKRQRWSDSERRQVAQQRQRAADEGIPFADRYRDLGVSSFRGRNRILGMLGQFLDDVKNGPPLEWDDSEPWPQPGDTLGTESFDRISRAPVYDSSGYIREIIDSGIVLQVRARRYTRALINANSGMYNEITNELERAHSESEFKSIRGREVNEAKRKAAIAGEGIFAGNRGPVWIKPNDDKTGYLWCEPHASTARYIFQLADAECGTLTIASILNKDLKRYPVFDRRKNVPASAEWNENTIGRLLRDRAVIGEWQPYLLIDGYQRVKHGTPVPDHYLVDGKPLIDDYPLFRRVQDGLDRRKKAGGRRGEHARNMFLGIGTCICGGKLRITKGRTAYYLRCTRSRRGGCDLDHGFRYDVFEAAMMGAVPKMVQQMVARLARVDRPDYESQIAVLEAAVSAKQKTIDALFQRYASHSSDAARAAADRQIEMMGTAIDDDNKALTELRDQVTMAPLRDEYAALLHERFERGNALITSDDQEARRGARIALWGEWKRIIDRMVLDDGQIIDVQINDGRDGPVALAFAVNREGGVCGAQYVNRSDGSPANAFGAMIA
jgi:hypothetical protein